MANNLSHNTMSTEEGDAPVVVRRRLQDGAELDITPMIDITFLLLIFFLVASTPDSKTSVELPPARYGTGVSSRTSIIITVADAGSKKSAQIYLADGKIGTPLAEDHDLQEEQIVRAVEEGHAEGKATVLLKAEKGVKYREVNRVALAVGKVEGIQLHLAVFEME